MSDQQMTQEEAMHALCDAVNHCLNHIWRTMQDDDDALEKTYTMHRQLSKARHVLTKAARTTPELPKFSGSL